MQVSLEWTILCNPMGAKQNKDPTPWEIPLVLVQAFSMDEERHFSNTQV